MAKRRQSAYQVWLLAAFCASCDGCDEDDDYGDVVKTHVDSSANFTAFHTFAFSASAPAPNPAPSAIPATVSSQLTLVDNAVRNELTGRGLVEVTPDQNPDLFVVSLASTDQEQALSWECVPGNWWGYWWGYTAWSWDPCAWLDPLYVEYEIGTVAVALVQVEAQDVPFGGVMQGVLYNEYDGDGLYDEDEDDAVDDVTDRVNDDVARMFEDYPVGQTGSAP